MTDINKLIEEERKRYDSDTFNFFSEEERIIAKAKFTSGANFILHHYRWRKVNEGMPEHSGNPFLVRGYFDVEGHKSFERRCFTAYQDMDFYEMFKEVIFDAPAYFVVTEWKPIE